MGTVRYATERARQHARDYQREYKRRRRKEAEFKARERTLHLQRMAADPEKHKERLHLQGIKKQEEKRAERERAEQERRDSGLLTYTEAAHLLGIQYHSLAQQVRLGKVAVQRQENGRPLFTREEIERYRHLRKERVHTYAIDALTAAKQTLTDRYGVDDWMSKRDAATLMQVHPHTINQMERAGKIDVKRIDGRVLLSRAEVERCLRESPPRRLDFSGNRQRRTKEAKERRRAESTLDVKEDAA